MKRNKKFRKDDLSSGDSTKRIYKMYKKKKQWVVAPVTILLMAQSMYPVVAAAEVINGQEDASAITQKELTEFEQRQQEAIANIEKLTALTSDEKAAFVIRVNESTEVSALEILLKEAYVQDVTNIADTLTTEYFSAIDALKAIPNEAEAGDSKVAFKEAITEKLAISSLIEEFTNFLTYNEESKEGGIQEYSAAKQEFDDVLGLNKVEADKILAEAVALNQALIDLEGYKTEQKTSINALTYLTDIEKVKFNQKITLAITKEAVDAAVSEAKAVNTEGIARAVNKKADELRKITERLNTINPTLQTELDAQIEATIGAADEAALKALQELEPSILEKVKKAEEENASTILDSEKQALKETIAEAKANHTFLTDADVKAFNSKVDSAKTSETVKEIANEWTDFVALKEIEDIAKLTDARNAAFGKVGELEHIDAVLKANYQHNIQLATSKEEVAKLFEEAMKADRAAQAKAVAELKTAKEQAIKIINALKEITPAQKQEFIETIESDEISISGINDTLEDAKDAEKTAELSNTRNAATNTVNTLSSLTESERDGFLTTIGSAADVAAITEVLNQAIHLNYTKSISANTVTTEEAKSIAKEALDLYSNLTAKDREKVISDINKATDKDILVSILEAAKEVDKQNSEANNRAKELEEAKATAKAAIDALLSLSQETKAGYKAQIKNAKNTDEVEEILATATGENNLLEDNKAILTQKKQELVSAINDELAFLTDADKKELIIATVDCSTVAEVATVQAKASRRNQDRQVESLALAGDLEALISGIKIIIDGLESLTTNQKMAYNDAADEIKNATEANTFYEAVKAENDRLHDKKITNDIEKYIASGFYVDAQKAINKLQLEANRKEYQAKLDNTIALSNAKADAIVSIDSLVSLSTKEKQEAKETVIKLTSFSEVEKFLNELIEKDIAIHDKELIELADLQIEAGQYEKAEKTIEKIISEKEKERLNEKLKEAKEGKEKPAPEINIPEVKGTGHVSKIGWQKAVMSNGTIGTTGRGLPLEAIKLELGDTELAGSIQYRTHVSKIGWQAPVFAGAIAGTTGKKLPVEAIEISLTGELAKKFKVEYRAHVAKIGWTNWVTDGTMAGTTGRKLSMEAVQVRLVKK